MKITTNNQYKSDIFKKLNMQFVKHARMLDLGCGDGVDAQIFIDRYKLHTYGIDLLKHENIDSINKLNFRIGSIYSIPFKNTSWNILFQIVF